MIVRTASVILVVMAAPWWAACGNPCSELAERICACERTQQERQACRADRITSQRREISADQAEVCAINLDTCTCQALDENRLEACGFSP
jgi:hypothetical protein